MHKFFLCFLLSVLLLWSFSQNPGDSKNSQLRQYATAIKLFEQAEQLSHQSYTNEQLQTRADSIYKKALNSFNQLLPSTEKNYDSLSFFIRLKTGLIYYYFDSLQQAKKNYLSVIDLKKKVPSIADSFLFVPCLFTGRIYYGQSEFDSAMFYYKRAEQIVDQYGQKLQESQRLYNMLGVMYYERGNYAQARNYFEKAILLTDPSDQTLIANYKINIASLLIKLEKFEEAKNIYLNLLSTAAFQNEIYHNLAIISLKEKQYLKAIDYLQNVKYGNNKKSIDLFYNLGAAYSGLNQNDSAEFYLQRAIAENLKWNGKTKNVQYGIILKYQADEFSRQQLFQEASDKYQQAIVQFATGYTDNDPNNNPTEFSGAYSYINLFNTLASKGECFANWYQLDKNIGLLESALNAYRSAFKLADYVEKTYESDEARLFLGKIKHTVHSYPINVSLLLYELTGKKNYLEDAYMFDQQNKASALAFNVQQQQLRKEAGPGNDLFRTESFLKSAITRLSLRAVQITDSIELSNIHTEIRDLEIELGKTRQKLNQHPRWSQRIAETSIPPVKQVQRTLDHSSALISYHLSDKELLILFITQSRFEYFKLPINKSFFATIDSFKLALQITSSENRYDGAAIAKRLHDKLIIPVYQKFMQIKRLIIIPDDELHYLPFEALQDENKKYLVERFSVQYQYSTALLDRTNKKSKRSSTLSFAPFANGSYKDSTGVRLASLPSSGEEIKGLPGMSFTDQDATKENFLSSVNRFSIVHLATHAIVNNEQPALSFISFYPADQNYKLYAPEIANLQLDSAQLVILSACETGTGKLVKGEGLMSLSRAFAYAGCPDIITSLWKAEDKTTAFLTRQLHYYLDQKYTKDKALQQAKLDLLSSDKIDPRLKSPVYWAHLVFIGDYEPKINPVNWWWIAIAFIVGAVAYKLLGKKKVNR